MSRLSYPTGDLLEIHIIESMSTRNLYNGEYAVTLIYSQSGVQYPGNRKKLAIIIEGLATGVLVVIWYVIISMMRRSMES